MYYVIKGMLQLKWQLEKVDIYLKKNKLYISLNTQMKALNV